MLFFKKLFTLISRSDSLYYFIRGETGQIRVMSPISYAWHWKLVMVFRTTSAH